MMRHGSSSRGRRGFTLLEAIVAMTIFSMCALALFGWQATSLRTIDRIGEHARRAERVSMALAAVQGINPMAEPAGERLLGSQRVTWKATLVEPVRTGVSMIGLPSIFDVGLYEVSVTVAGAPDLAATQSFKIRLVGYRQARRTGLEE